MSYVCSIVRAACSCDVLDADSFTCPANLKRQRPLPRRRDDTGDAEGVRYIDRILCGQDGPGTA